MLFWWALSSLDPERTLRSILARAGRDCQASGRSYLGWSIFERQLSGGRAASVPLKPVVSQPRFAAGQ